MRLSEYGFKPATIACLHNAGIDATWELDDHTYRELIWHSQIPAPILYDVLCVLHQQDKTLKPTTRKNARPLTERNLEIFRLRVVEGHTLKEVGEQVSIGTERVRQILARHFGLYGEPPAAKVQPRRNRKCNTAPDCSQLGSAIQRLRTAKGLTIEQIAAKTDMSAEQLERIEDGLRDPTWTTLHRLAVALDTTAALLAYAIEVERLTDST
jgi:ribosome-binding protein aMBF1 (putative translation factor)